MKYDLNYICKTMGNLSGIPVRLYEDGQVSDFYSMIYLPKDPMVIYKEEILAIEEPIGYYATQSLNYYGIFNIENKKIIIGPTRFVPNSEQELREMAFRADVSPEEIPEFVAGMKAIVGLPLERLMQMLCLLNYLITGEKIEMSQMIIHEFQQEAIKRTQVSWQMDQMLEMDKFYYEVDNTFLIESSLMEMISAGNLAALHEWLKKPITVRSGLCAPNPIRQLKNTMITTAALASRSAIRGGMDPGDAIRMANGYIYNAELMDKPEEIVNLQYQMLNAFAEKVSIVKFGEIQSKLVAEVANYIQHNLSSPITVEEIAEALYMSRPYLSKKFKEEAGISVSDFIHKQKIDEAKRLLKYTDKSLLAISVYLGFSSQSHFTHVFKKMTGKLPKEYRDGMDGWHVN